MGKGKPPGQKNKGVTMSLSEFAGDTASANDLPTAPKEDDGCAAAPLWRECHMAIGPTLR